MLQILTLILLFPFFSCSQAQQILLQDYHFLGVDDEVTKLHQSNDTLYEFHCYITRPCVSRPQKHYKIISSEKAGDFIVLKLERLDTILLTTNPYPETRYSTLALKKVNDKQLGYLPLVLGLSKKQLDTIQTNASSLKDKFFFTFYSDAYKKDLSLLKKITTRDEAKEIIETAKSEKFKPLAGSYQKTETRDMYAAGFSAELLSRACIEKGYSPVGAGQAINALMKQ